MANKREFKLEIGMEIGRNRRQGGDRRKFDRGGPLIELPKLIYTREEAIDRILEEDVEMMNDWDSSDMADLILNGWKGTPLKKCTNKELAEDLQDREQDDRIRVRG